MFRACFTCFTSNLFIVLKVSNIAEFPTTIGPTSKTDRNVQ